MQPPADLGAVADDDVLGADVHVAADGAGDGDGVGGGVEVAPHRAVHRDALTCGEHVALRRAAHADAVAREERVVLRRAAERHLIASGHDIRSCTVHADDPARGEQDTVHRGTAPHGLSRKKQ